VQKHDDKNDKKTFSHQQPPQFFWSLGELIIPLSRLRYNDMKQQQCYQQETHKNR